MSLRTGLVAAGLAAVALAGCRGRVDLDGSRRALPGLEERGAAFEMDLGSKVVAFDLYDNRAGLVLHVDGSLFVDADGLDLAKYSAGHPGSGFEASEDLGGAVVARGAGISVPFDRDKLGIAVGKADTILLRVRGRSAVEGQLVSVLINGERIGDISMPDTKWREYAMAIPSSRFRIGENSVRFYFRHVTPSAGREVAAVVSHIRLGGRPGKVAGQGKPLRARERSRAGKRMAALEVAAAARLSYYVEVPQNGPELAFAVAGEGGDVTVAIAEDGIAAQTVWHGQAGEEWAPVRVDLARYSGRVVRIDLRSSGAVEWGRPRLLARPAPTGRVALGKIDHVIVWSVASLRADRVYDGIGRTPSFTRFARGAAGFTSVESAAPDAGAAHAALMSGRLVGTASIAERRATLAEQFRKSGFSTALFSGNGFITEAGGFARGFDEYQNPMRESRPHSADVLWRMARGFLSPRREGRTFLYLATSEPHLPYTPSDGSLGREWSGTPELAAARTAVLSRSVQSGNYVLNQRQRSFVRALYDAEVRDADAAFGRMLAELEELGIADRTAVILVGDHGEELFERGGFGHGDHLHAESVRVPLLIRAPGLPPGRVDVSAELVDVAATALAIAGIPADPRSQGDSLLPYAYGSAPVVSRPVRSVLPGQERAIRIGEYRWIERENASGKLYNVFKDPGEQVDLAGRHHIAERHLRTALGLDRVYGAGWSRRRWGTVNNMSPAFAADHGG